MSDPAIAYGLLALGLMFLLAEFIFPTFGIMFGLAIASLLAGIALSFAGNPGRGLITLVGVFLILVTVGPLIVRYYPRTPLGKKFMLARPDEDDTMAAMPNYIEMEQLRGRYGRTVSALRPSGVTLFDGKRVDTITQGEMIDAGQWVRVIDVQSNRVIVRRVEKPPELEDFSPNDMLH